MPIVAFDALDRSRPVPREVLARAKRAACLDFARRRRVRVALDGLRALGRVQRLDVVDHRCLVMAWQLTTVMTPRTPVLPPRTRVPASA